MTRSSASPSHRIVRWIPAAVVGLLGLALFLPGRAQGKVDPLMVLKRQIHSPNMLILMDTSGSMTGVPGGEFSDASEVGVDCDDGVNCRGNTAHGACSISGRACNSDGDCQTPYCRTGGASCNTDPDCATSGSCSVTHGSCSRNSDCPAQTTGTCNPSGDSCSAGHACPAYAHCTLGTRSCTNPGGLCNYGTCDVRPSLECTSDSDCPPAATGGSCTLGGAPAGGCSVDADCPLRKRCVTGESCSTVADCPAVTTGSCSRDSSACTRDSDCHGWGNSCVFPARSCSGAPNTCTLPATNCTLYPANRCNSVTNSCAIPTNSCAIPTANVCLPPASGDVCNAASSTAGAMRMCRLTQALCNQDSDCTTAGDACGPPSSRTVIAKRTLAKVVAENYNIINFGFMTFYQGGYFPYYQVTGPTPAGTERHLYAPTKIDTQGCFDATHGPTAICTFGGLTYTLAAAPNSRYEVNHGHGVKTQHDQDYCGNFCAVPGVGTGKWVGTYYVRSSSSGSVTTTKIIQPTYGGHAITVSDTNYQYFTPRDDYYSSNTSPPIDSVRCGAQCSVQCGARWDTQLSTFLDPNGPKAIQKQNALKILEWMEKVADGGLMTYGGTPTGCALENDVAPTVATSAYTYMNTVKTSDNLPCRNNFVLLITDGEANGPGDINGSGDSICSTAACGAADPEAAGCRCRAVLAAWHMRRNLNVRTFVVGFSTEVTSGSPRITNDNIAKAGGTDQGGDGNAPYAFAAANETELVAAIQNAIFQAVKGSYSTSPASSSSGTQMPLTIQSGKYALDARVDFPSWNGHLLAYDVTVEPPVLAWDAATQLAATNWWERRIYVGGPNESVVKIDVDPASKAVRNKAALFDLGMGASPDEAERIARFTMGDPGFKNPAVLGSIINSTPIDVGQPGDSPAPGGHEFFVAYRNRPNLTYVGSDDGMLHAFFTNPTTVAGAHFAAGSEAFAYISADMLSVVTKIYTQGGQIADPGQHIYGLANSAKVKNLCLRNCTDSLASIWKTVLVMPEGYGGVNTFMLDITNPVSDSGFADPPVSPIWHSDDSSLKASYDDALGQTLSVPAFFFNNTATLDDYRLIFASGYKTDPTSVHQGRQIVVATAATGTILDRRTIVPAGGCSQEFALLTDVATSKDYGRSQNGKLIGAYVGDTWGSLWRYSSSGLTQMANFGCTSPLHFAPTVVQLDRDDSANFPHDIYLVQVTNSSLDDDTDDFPPSQMIIIKEKTLTDGSQGIDTSFGTAGRLALTVGHNDQLCGVTDPTGACTLAMPANARPTGTPMAILKRDGTGFQILSLWYAPDTTGCGKGRTFLALHELVGDRVLQKQGIAIASEPVTSPVIVGGRVYIVGSTGVVNVGGSISATFATGASSPRAGVGAGRFGLLGWSEVY